MNIFENTDKKVLKGGIWIHSIVGHSSYKETKTMQFNTNHTICIYNHLGNSWLRYRDFIVIIRKSNLLASTFS
jgi:hypothetical protein